MEKLKKIGNGLIGGVILYIINILRAWTIHNMDFPEFENVFFFLDLFGIFIRSVYKELHADRETGC